MKNFKSLFQSKISVKEIEILEKKLIHKLSCFDQNFEIFYNYKKSKLSNIFFSFKPKGISIMREYENEEAYKLLKQKNNEIQNIKGVKIFNKKSKQFENVNLSFSNYLLKFIQNDSPENFHKIFDINKIQIEEYSIEKIKIQNPEKEIVLKILTPISNEELNKLDLENCIEIEFESNLYYTIIDFENGDYIAINYAKNVYYLNHNLTQFFLKIDDDASNFIASYNGNKKTLSKILESNNI